MDEIDKHRHHHHHPHHHHPHHEHAHHQKHSRHIDMAGRVRNSNFLAQNRSRSASYLGYGLQTVVIPDRARPGFKFDVPVGNRIAQVLCPLGSKPGDTVRVRIVGLAGGGPENSQVRRGRSEMKKARSSPAILINPHPVTKLSTIATELPDGSKLIVTREVDGDTGVVREIGRVKYPPPRDQKVALRRSSKRKLEAVKTSQDFARMVTVIVSVIVCLFIVAVAVALIYVLGTKEN